MPLCIICKKSPGTWERRSLHRFPARNKKLKEKWIESLRITSAEKDDRVCCDHFSPTSFCKTIRCSGQVRLNPDAVPELKNYHNATFPTVDDDSNLPHDKPQNGNEIMPTNKSTDVTLNENEKEGKEALINSAAGSIPAEVTTNSDTVRGSQSRQHLDAKDLFDTHHTDPQSLKQTADKRDDNPLIAASRGQQTTSESNHQHSDPGAQTSSKKTRRYYRLKTQSGFLCLNESSFSSPEIWNSFQEYMDAQQKSQHAAHMKNIRAERTKLEMHQVIKELWEHTDLSFTS